MPPAEQKVRLSLASAVEGASPRMKIGFMNKKWGHCSPHRSLLLFHRRRAADLREDRFAILRRLVLDGDINLAVGRSFDGFTQGQLVVGEVEAQVFKELSQPPCRGFGDVEGVLDLSGFSFTVGQASGDFEFLCIHVGLGGDDLMGEFDELGLLLGGFVVPREADNAGEVGADWQRLGLFDFRAGAIEDGSEVSGVGHVGLLSVE